MLEQNQIKQVATLAKLNVDDNIDAMATDLNTFIDLIDTLAEVDTTGVEPMAHPFDVTQRLRADTPSTDINREAFQAVAPEVSEGHYLVPKVL